MTVIIDITTICISFIIFLKSLKKIRMSSKYVIHIVFFIIYVLPLFLDYTIGIVDYRVYWNASTHYIGFIESYQDESTRIIYDVFLIISQLIFLFILPSKPNPENKELVKTGQIFEINKYGSVIFVVLGFLAPIICLFCGFYEILFRFGWRDSGLYEEVIKSNLYYTIEKITYIGIVSGCCLLFSKHRRKLVLNIVGFFIVVMNVSIESKRSALFFAIAVSLIVLLCYNGKIKLKDYIFISVIGMIGVLLYSIFVKTEYRGYSGFKEIYTNIRIDFFRDDRVKMVIYSFLRSTERRAILEYPFQSYLTQISSFFPIDFFVGKKIFELPIVGFNTYFTSSLMGSLTLLDENWMTTSMCDEMWANFSFGSIIIFPLLLKLFSNLIDSKSLLEKPVWLSLILLLFMYSINYISYYIEFTILIHVFIMLIKHRGKKENIDVKK